MFLSKNHQESGQTGTTSHTREGLHKVGAAGRPKSTPATYPLSSIRTVTVGFGIAPNLLTPYRAARALAGFDRTFGEPMACSSPPVGNFTPP